MPIKTTGIGSVHERLRRLEQAINFAEAVLVVSAVGTEDTSGASGFSSSVGGDPSQNVLVVNASRVLTIGTVVATVAARPRRSGTFILEPPGGFLRSQVGKPVFITQRASRDDSDECEQLLCTAEILTTKKMRVRWMSLNNALVRGTKRFQYLIAA